LTVNRPKNRTGKQAPSAAPVDDGRAVHRPSTAVDVASEGQRLLRAVDGSLAQIAEKVGCSKTIAGDWRNGTKLPSAAMRGVLQEKYGIPPTSWDCAPGAELPPDEPPAPLTEDLDDDDPLAIVNHQIAVLRRELQNRNLSETARANKQDALSKYIGQRIRIEKDKQLSVEQLIKSPEWAELTTAMCARLQPWPEAMEALAAFLEERARKDAAA
jgi:transcriptional regulator with XRE-family HTH domain